MAAPPLEPLTEEADVYRALVVDSGPIIRMTGLTSLRDKALEYYTVPAVIQEIRDAKARQHLDQLPFKIKTRDPSAEAVHAIIEFARQTGDYQSLSSVDIQVLALQYDLEREGCGIDHIRRTPKRTVGGGRVESMGERKKMTASSTEADKAGGDITTDSKQGNITFFENDNIDIVEDDEEDVDEEGQATSSGPKSWAMLVNPTAASKTQAIPDISDEALTVPFRQMKLVADDADSGGQFSDAEDEEFDPTSLAAQNDGEDSDDDGYGGSDCDISDEECDIYILDPEEVEERKRAQKGAKAVAIAEELQSDFPSLAASVNVPYDGDSDNEVEGVTAAVLSKQEADKKKEESLKPVTNSGKLYNSFRKYGDVVRPKEDKPKREEKAEEIEEEEQVMETAEEPRRDTQSRIIGGNSMSGQGLEVEDDGEGWITSTKDIRKMKAAGRLNPTTTPAAVDKDNAASKVAGPAVTVRTACATTDFAMQNVILQMNLELLSVDGMKVRRLKSWVSRCGACFTVFSNDANNGPYEAKRLFCSRCGSDMIQRIACSVDSKTGRLRLHLSKKYKTNVRGTKFSLPKPGSNNRFQGDLLLREDQMLMGAWNQKVKKLSGGKSKAAASSMFGSDLAANVGCHAKTVHADDVRVGFGRRNPNSAKGGRERRGKKKKSGDKACGLRRY